VRSVTALLPVALVAALLAGCSGQTSSKNAKDFTGEQKQIATVIDDLGSATRDRDGKQVCTSLLAPQLAAKLTQGTKTCADVIHDQLSDANIFGVDVKSIKVTGPTATAVVESQFNGKDVPRTLHLRKVGNSWRIESLGAG
jgi:hypothetical protein